MKSLKGTRTAVNLLQSFAGESQARNRYNTYASIADKEGYKQIRNIFNETADNEREHAKRFYKFLLAGFDGDLPQNIEIQAGFPVAQGTTLENLKYAANGENEEWSILYPKFADIADEEGFPEIAEVFRAIASAEEKHEIRFNKLAENIEKVLYLKEMVKYSGNVVIADIFTKGMKLLISVLHVLMPRLILNYSLKHTNL